MFSLKHKNLDKWKAMLPSKLPSGQWLVPRWWALIFGGNYRQRKAKIQTQTGYILDIGGGYGWRPSLLRLIYIFYLSGNKTLWEFCKFADQLYIRESDKILFRNWWFSNSFVRTNKKEK